MNNEGGVQAEEVNDLQLLRKRINQGRDILRRDNGVGMAVKSNHDRNGSEAPGLFAGLAEDALVPQMDAVKNTNGHANPARPGLQVSGGMDDEIEMTMFCGKMGDVAR